MLLRIYGIFLLLLLLQVGDTYAQKRSNEIELASPLTRTYVYPTRVLWSEGDLENAPHLLEKGNGQANLTNTNVAKFKNTSASRSSILLDFGKEMNGALEMVTGMWPGGGARNIRVRFGESANEAMAELGEKGATNDHALRDIELALPWLGKNQTGESGFRFARIDFLDTDAELHLREVRVISTIRDIPYEGSFHSSDERLNKIWEVGAYTVHLNMQDYLWDGIKRDRLVWVGDLHPEVATVNAVFGYNDVVPKSLDLARDATPLPGWMCGISTYSMWWIILHHDWYMHHGNLKYLAEQKPYLQGLVKQIVEKVKDGKEDMNGNRFLDWPSSEDPKAIHAGLQALAILSLERAAEISEALHDVDTKKLCEETVAAMRKYVPEHNNSKQAAALLANVDLLDAEKAYDQVLSIGGSQNFSTFYGYYMLEAMAKAGKYEEALAIINEFWGAMLDLGATTFWEDFNMEWLPNAARIDELVPEGKKDIHGDYGAYCYLGYRHSFCHGWASGPTAWLSEHVLGIQVIEPGSRKFKVRPNLGHLTFVEGTYPTPFGNIWVKHTKLENGKIKSKIKAPKGVKIIR